MANLRYITPSALHVQVSQQRRLLFFPGLRDTLDALALHPLLDFLGVVLLASLRNYGEWRLHSASGEERALGYPVV